MKRAYTASANHGHQTVVITVTPDIARIIAARMSDEYPVFAALTESVACHVETAAEVKARRTNRDRTAPAA